MPERSPTQSTRDPGISDPDHHLWRNGRLWWVAFTVHLPGWQKERVRRLARHRDLAEARRRRDELLRALPGAARLRAVAADRRPARARRHARAHGRPAQGARHEPRQPP